MRARVARHLDPCNLAHRRNESSSAGRAGLMAFADSIAWSEGRQNAKRNPPRVAKRSFNQTFTFVRRERPSSSGVETPDETARASWLSVDALSVDRTGWVYPAGRCGADLLIGRSFGEPGGPHLAIWRPSEWLEHLITNVACRCASQHATHTHAALVATATSTSSSNCRCAAGLHAARKRYLITNVVDVEPTLPALSATRTASVCVPLPSPCARSIRRSSVASSNRPSAVVPTIH